MILVTGGTGLVGAHLLVYLTEHEQQPIRALYRNAAAVEKTKALFARYQKEALFEKIAWVEADILDIPALERAFENCDYVYHCAGLISFNPNDEERLRKVNIEGTANIVNLCLDFKVKKLCHVSSIAALGSLAPNEAFISETTEWNPEVAYSDYAISKYGAEMEVWRGYQEGLPVILVNPGVVFGPGFWNQGSGVFFSTVQKGLPFYTQGSTGYVAVSDVVTIMHQLMISDNVGERYVLVAENFSFKDMIFLIAEKLGVKKPRFEARLGLLNLAWKVDWFLHLLFRKPRRLYRLNVKTLTAQETFSNRKIVETLGYTFTRMDLYLDSILTQKNNF
ncbi:NAD-dependent epimerase/dehydratase family protein [Flavobacterium aciduliphilum]|uniref:Nucleoside-diphosphate-sugar epimerase n=1 Tax=Flavobacterium aciduliphilum TaxID=1101402 RepID=A0A328YKB8_9FLAO|nr:NAD-dependent epimerase/dehydratase family protein [Flavobacterium aciduliphilum]RAR72502.1 nucleoside-diphosphate-sugar epimerase [Flavobacterium aciduliphilum]